MKKVLLIVVTTIIAVNLSYGQSHRELPIYRNFNGTPPDSANTLDSTAITYGGWSIQSVIGTKSWYVGHYTANYYVHGNGFASTGQTAQEQWFITPGFSTVTYPNANLKFSSCQKFAGTPIQVLVSTNYAGTGLPATATWTDITSSLTLPPTNLSGPRVWKSSGNVNLSSYVGANVYVAFKYLCDATSATDWEVDSISITNTSGINKIYSLEANIYPNPATNFVTISAKENISLVQIFDMQGRIVMEYNFNGTSEIKLNVSGLPKGLYNIVALSTKGNAFSTKLLK